MRKIPGFASINQKAGRITPRSAIASGISLPGTVGKSGGSAA
ncbi:hypothetical protein NIES3974_41180 [Calothrix sp. NIES-3974]|nr:hypothetical protein NIES3974_41180 [Calothrix sp. NIES-3974]